MLNQSNVSEKECELLETHSSKQEHDLHVYVITETLQPGLFGGQHVFIILKQMIDGQNHYFFLDTDRLASQYKSPFLECNLNERWKTGIPILEKTGEFFVDNESWFFKKMRYSYTPFTIKGNIFIIAEACNKYMRGYSYSYTNNCADITAWFLEIYVDIPKPQPCSLPITCDRVGYGCWLPSFFQCITLPDRVMKAAEMKQAANAPSPITMK